MRDAGVEFRGIWKKFKRGELHDSLRDLIPAVANRLVGRRPRSDRLSGDEFWALTDVSFEVRPGEALGIIGPNGAGKSTTLKILNRILRPNRGEYVLRGRVGALIELAAGFHPDLTGRENIYLQGAIMGMKRAEIASKFDEIVGFSGISEFIDTPVKRYSSGMNARLGFSIAAHMDPDVLLIDEVLSVGDMMFQRKAFDRLQALARGGMPIVVVSHQLQRIASLCTDAILLQKGEVAYHGSPKECIANYVLNANVVEDSFDDVPVKLANISIPPGQAISSGEYLTFVVEGETVDEDKLDDLTGVAIRVRSGNEGTTLFASSTAACDVELPRSGPFRVEMRLQLNVPPGIYSVEANVWDRKLGRQVARGPSAQVEVLEGSRSGGLVQMNPQMRLVSPCD